MVLNNEQLKYFSEEGYLLLKNVISSEEISNLQNAIYTMAKKCLPGKEEGLGDLLLLLEALDHNLVYKIQKAMGTSSIASKIISNLDLNAIHAQLYKIPIENVHSHLFQTPFQFPEDSSFDFAWHQESGSYGASYSKILTCWFPIFGKVNSEMGSTELIPSTHKDGIRDTVHHVYDSGLNDWVVSPSEDEINNAFVVDLDVGDVLLFDSDVIHRSVANNSSLVRITGIARTLDICCMKEINVLAEPTNYVNHE